MYHSLRLALIYDAFKRADYIRKKHLFGHMGNHCMVMFRKVPLYPPKKIFFGNNVWIASNVSLITHEVISGMLNNKYHTNRFKENIGTITLGDYIFIGANSSILMNVTIGSNVIVGAGSLINKDLESGGVYAGVPAKKLVILKNM